MYTVYIIQSIKHGSYYKGFTTNLRQRIEQHNLGKVKSTTEKRPWKLIFYAVFVNKEKALAFEKYLKSGSGVAFMRKRLI